MVDHAAAARRLLQGVNPLTRAAVSLLFIITATAVGSPEILAVWLTVALLSSVALTTLGTRSLIKRLTPFLVVGLGFLWMNLLFHRSGDLGLGLRAGGILVLRALVFGGFSIFFVADLDHEQFAASMIRFARVPPRIVYATLIAFRLGPVLAEERRSIALSLALRGVPADRRLRSRIGAWARQSVGVFVAALRRASRIAVAFEARGLDDGPRTFRTVPRFGAGDALFLSVYVLLLAGTFVLIRWDPWSGGFSEG
ncbi:MAG: energy-coupling factor transporter transmembrane component T [Spirochaeta sp.]|nr:energy-coupling factor transporter transmembrane component T [Spirochaeta sp.]